MIHTDDDLWDIPNSNLKKHIALSHTGEKPFFAIFVANGLCEIQPKRAYAADPYKREAIFCKSCGNKATYKYNL